MATASFVPDYNGYIYDNGSTWANLLTMGNIGASDLTDTTANCGTLFSTPSYYSNELFLQFDSATTLNGSSISAVTFSTTCTDVYWPITNAVVLELYSFDFGASLTIADARTGGSAGWLQAQYSGGHRIASYAFSGSESNNTPFAWTINSSEFIAAIPTDGASKTRLVMMSSFFRSDSAPGADACRAQLCLKDHATAAYRPTLGVTYTAAVVPTLTTKAVTAITSSTASSGGTVTDQGSASVTAKGVCWNKTGTPTIADAHTSD